MAIPFVPGAEIGLGVMMILGPKIVPLVYLCTLISLFLSFIVGRLIPDKSLIRFLHNLHLRKASLLLAELEGLDSKQRFNLLIQRSPKKIVPFLLKHRYLALLIVINAPGNIVFGGGGGIAMSAGMSRIFSIPLFLLTITIAVSPLPLMMIIFGANFADWPVWYLRLLAGIKLWPSRSSAGDPQLIWPGGIRRPTADIGDNLISSANLNYSDFPQIAIDYSGEHTAFWIKIFANE